MIQIVLHRRLSLIIACSDVMQWDRGDTSHGLPPVIGLTWG